MAAGDLKFFGRFAHDLALGNHDLANDTFKLALITSTWTPTTGMDQPMWTNANSGVDVSTYACTVWDNGTTTGGYDISGVFTFTTGVGVAAGTFDGSNVTWDQGATGSTSIRYGIIYNESAPNNDCLGWIVIGDGSDVSAVTGDVQVNWHVSGIATVTVA